MATPLPEALSASSVSSTGPSGVSAGEGAISPPVIYRPNVAAIILNMDNSMLVAQRSSIRSAWQFPQGGVDPGEGLEEALFREVQEEVGIKPELIELLDRKGGYRYDFPKGRLKYGIYGGQEQVYYLCRFLGKDRDINLNTEHREFDRWRWIKPEKFDMEWVPRFKREVYARVFRDFFGMEK
jgi:putative (di)nucleoside polyphosphate hydrolase